LVEEKDKKEETDRPRPNRKVVYKENSRCKLEESHFIGKLEKLASIIKWMYTGKSPEHCN